MAWRVASNDWRMKSSERFTRWSFVPYRPVLRHISLSSHLLTLPGSVSVRVHHGQGEQWHPAE